MLEGIFVSVELQGGKIMKTRQGLWLDTYNAAISGLMANSSHDPMSAIKVAEQVADKTLEVITKKQFTGEVAK